MFQDFVNLKKIIIAFVCAIIMNISLMFSVSFADKDVGTEISKADNFMREYRVDGASIIVIEDVRNPVSSKIMPSIEKDTNKLALLDGATTPVNVVLIRPRNNKKSVIMIDSGWGREHGSQGRTMQALEKLGLKPENIERILITHMHIDHISGLIEKDQALFPNARIYISRPEYEYWITKGTDKSQKGVELAKKVAKIYEPQIVQFDFDQKIVPGILAEDGTGHTHGHTLFSLQAGKNKILFMGDSINVEAIQAQYPEISTVYDVNPEKATLNRQKVLERASKSNELVLGAHTTGLFRVKKEKNGGFSFKQMQ